MCHQGKSLLRVGLRYLFVVTFSLLLQSLAGAQTWQLTWSDEFNGLSGSNADSSKWTYEKGATGASSNELQLYCAPSDAFPCDPANRNAFVDGNNLVIQPRIASDGTWTSAKVKTRGILNVQYGRIEISARIPAHAGLAPVFFMLGTDIGGIGQPNAGEIDLMRNGSGIGPTKNLAFLQGNGYFGDKSLSNTFTFQNGERVDTAFHLYGAIWSPDMVQFYVDDPTNVVFIRTAHDVPAGSTWPFNNPFYLNLGLSVGGNFGGAPDSGTATADPMLVDYVHYYQAAQVPGPAMTASPLTIKSGETGSSKINLSSASGTGLVYLACTGAPANSSCSIDSGNTLNRSAVDFTVDSSATASLKVAAFAQSAELKQPPIAPWAGTVGTAGMFAMILLPFSGKINGRLRLGLALLGIFAAMTVLQGCGGGSGSNSNNSGSLVIPGNYSLTVTAYTVSGDTSSINVPLTIN